MPRMSLEEVLGAAEEPTLPPGRKPPGRQVEAELVHQRRLLAATLRVVAETGFHDATVSDIVRTARVSRRTFYLHFSGKLECFLVACDVTTDALIEQFGGVMRAAPSPSVRLVAGLSAYFAAFAANPALARVFTLDLPQSGPEGRDRRRELQARWAATLQAEVARLRRHDPAIAAATTELDDLGAVAAVGAIANLAALLGEGPDPGLLLPAVRRAALAQILGPLSAEGVAWATRLEAEHATGTVAVPVGV